MNSQTSTHILPALALWRRGRLRRLAGVCLVHKAGWWTYRWCHEGEVRQFHTASDGTVEADWSLGAFHPKQSDTALRTMMAAKGWDARSAGDRLREREKARRQAEVKEKEESKRGASEGEGEEEGEKEKGDDRSPGHAPLGHYPQQFVGGQNCDETGKGRRTEVRFLCCQGTASAAGAATGTSSVHLKHSAAAAAAAGGGGGGMEGGDSDNGDPSFSTAAEQDVIGLVSFHSLSEPDLCTYEFNVCTPLVCVPAVATPAAITAAVSGGGAGRSAVAAPGLPIGGKLEAPSDEGDEIEAEGVETMR